MPQQTLLAEAFKKWLASLETQQFSALTKLIFILEDLGHQIRMPHSKSLGAGLFELREPHYGLRAYYGFLKTGAILLLSGGNKHSQERDIKKAYQLLKQEIQNG